MYLGIGERKNKNAECKKYKQRDKPNGIYKNVRQ